MSTRLLLSFLIICTVSASEPPVEQAMEATGLSAGLAVTMGSDAAIDRRILEARPGWLLLSLPGDSTASDNRRAELAGSDQGRATVHPLLSPSVPVFTRAAALLVVDADTLGDRAPDDQTIRTALRPYGTAFIKRNGTWTSITAPWPDSIADYPHWLGGADFSAQVPDQEIGQARSLRWQSARNEETGNTVIMANGILVSQMKVQIGWKTNLTPSAFDAFTGLRLWQRPLLRVFGKYAMVMDDKRVVLPYFEMKPKEHPQLAKERMQKMIAENTFKPVALDARTGETLLVYDEAPTMPMMDRNTSASNLTLNLVDGKLIVKVGGKIGVLDADSGKRLWQVEHKGKVLFPAVADGLLVVAQGTGLAHSRAHGHQYDADVTGFHTIIGYDLESGDERWRWQPDEVEHGNKVRLTMLNQNDGSVWLDYDVKIKRSQWFLLRIDPKTGNTI
jgi:outer membrane protein assembly factor BamB